MKKTTVTTIRPTHPPYELVCGKVSSGIEPIRENLYIKRTNTKKDENNR